MSGEKFSQGGGRGLIRRKVDGVEGGGGGASRGGGRRFQSRILETMLCALFSNTEGQCAACTATNKMIMTHPKTNSMGRGAGEGEGEGEREGPQVWLTRIDVIAMIP